MKNVERLKKRWDERAELIFVVFIADVTSYFYRVFGVA